MREPDADGGVGGSIRLGQFVICFGLLHGEQRGLQVRTGINRVFAIVVVRKKVVAEIEDTIDIEVIDGAVIFQQGEEIDLGGAQIDQSSLQVRFVLQPLQFEAIEIDAGNVSGLKAVAADF